MTTALICPLYAQPVNSPLHIDGIALVIEPNDVRMVARQRTHSLLDAGVAGVAIRILLRKNYDLLWLDVPHFDQIVHHSLGLFA